MNIERYSFSNYGIKDIELFKSFYKDFIEYCSTISSTGNFSTYTNGEPYFISGNSIEITYIDFLKVRGRTL